MRTLVSGSFIICLLMQFLNPLDLGVLPNVSGSPRLLGAHEVFGGIVHVPAGADSGCDVGFTLAPVFGSMIVLLVGTFVWAFGQGRGGFCDVIGGLAVQIRK